MPDALEVCTPLMNDVDDDGVNTDEVADCNAATEDDGDDDIADGCTNGAGNVIRFCFGDDTAAVDTGAGCVGCVGDDGAEEVGVEADD